MSKKKKNTTASAMPPEPETDELALVKAAAWAWYQHSTSSKNKQATPSGFPLATHRRRSSHRPSRYCLESLSTSNAPNASPVNVVSEKMKPITLLDLYEIERIKRELERFMAASERREKVQAKKVRMRKGTVVGCLMGRHAMAVCGSQGSAVETEALVGRRQERST